MRSFLFTLLLLVSSVVLSYPAWADKSPEESSPSENSFSRKSSSDVAPAAAKQMEVLDDAKRAAELIAAETERLNKAGDERSIDVDGVTNGNSAGPSEGEIPVEPAAELSTAKTNVPSTPKRLDAATVKAVEKLEAYLSATSSMTANFESVLLDPEGNISAEPSTGTLTIKRPGRFRWEYVAPYPSLMVADGVNLWTYDEDLDEAIVRQLADYEAASPMMLLSGDINVEDSFDVRGSHQVEGAQWLVLAPLEKDADFVTVRLKLSDDKIELMELVDKLDATSRIVFSDVVINPPVDSEAFSFTLPEGANLVGQPAPVPAAALLPTE